MEKGKTVYIVHEIGKSDKLNAIGLFNTLLTGDGETHNIDNIYAVFNNSEECERFINTQNRIAEIREEPLLQATAITLNEPIKSYQDIKYIIFTGRIRTDGEYYSSKYGVPINQNELNDSTVCINDYTGYSTVKSRIILEKHRAFNFIDYSLNIFGNHPMCQTKDDLNVMSRVITALVKNAFIDLGLWDKVKLHNFNCEDIGFEKECINISLLDYGHVMTSESFTKVMDYVLIHLDEQFQKARNLDKWLK